MERVPEISVVIPTRNRWEFLRRHALASALGQEDVAVEVVVVDDGSEDGTPSRVRALGDARVRVVEQGASHGQAQARNAGVAAARAEWVAFLDDDDLWAPRKLRLQLDAAGRAGAAFVYAGIAVVSPDLRLLEVVPAPDPAELPRAIRARNLLRAGSSTVLAHVECVREAGGFDPALDELADWDLWIRLAAAGPAAACPEVLVAYLAHPENRRVVDDSDVRAELDHLAGKHGLVGPAGRSLRIGFNRWVAQGELRRGQRRRAASTYTRSALAERDPGSAIRAVAALGGERAFAARRRLVTTTPAPAWLDRYR